MPILNLLCSRFLINIPVEEKCDPVKLCYHIELAHWFYLDFMRSEETSLPACSFKEFIATGVCMCPCVCVCVCVCVWCVCVCVCVCVHVCA